MLERDFDPARDRAVVLAAEGWHPGVIGIVASRVVERIHRPTVLIALGEEEGKGSARSIPASTSTRRCGLRLAPHPLRGHRMAAGCSIRAGAGGGVPRRLRRPRAARRSPTRC
jgi:single-stranded-DNA-specific exonuclease